MMGVSGISLFALRGVGGMMATVVHEFLYS